MDLETYSKNVHFFGDEVPMLLTDCLKRQEWRSIVDLGCGEGRLLHALKHQGMLAGKKVTAVDLSPDRVSVIRQTHPDFECHVASAQSVPFIQDGSVDVVVSTQVIEHVENEDEMIAEMRRVITPQGRLYISTVFKKWYGWYFYRCNGKWVLDPTHLREYRDEKPLLERFEKQGFRLLENRKELFKFPVSDFVLRRLASSQFARTAYEGTAAAKLMRLARAVKVPIAGYYCWEMVFSA